MSAKSDRLCQNLKTVLGDRVVSLHERLDEVTVEVAAADYVRVAGMLRNHPDLQFEELIDLSGIDYSTYTDYVGKRFAVVCHLISIANNWRVRLRVFAQDDNFPMLDSMTEVWNNANWYEREAFDFFGIMFSGHSDLRRILTDYGFVGHPFRKDFPVSGYVEMRYDPDQKRVIYQPVTIERREITPRIVREEQYGVAGRESDGNG